MCPEMSVVPRRIMHGLCMKSIIVLGMEVFTVEYTSFPFDSQSHIIAHARKVGSHQCKPFLKNWQTLIDTSRAPTGWSTL